MNKTLYNALGYLILPAFLICIFLFLPDLSSDSNTGTTSNSPHNSIPINRQNSPSVKLTSPKLGSTSFVERSTMSQRNYSHYSPMSIASVATAKRQNRYNESSSYIALQSSLTYNARTCKGQSCINDLYLSTLQVQMLSHSEVFEDTPIQTHATRWNPGWGNENDDPGVSVPLGEIYAMLLFIIAFTVIKLISINLKA